MDAQRKVTTFVVRGAGDQAELLVFWHTGVGTQVPAGTVEDGETYEQAARREAAEETGLPDLELVRRLGARTYVVPEGRGIVRRRVLLRTRAAPDAPVTSWSLERVEVEVVAREAGAARVVYQETDLDPGADGLVIARLEGWIPEDALIYQQRREFFLFRPTSDTPERWSVDTDGSTFHLSWVPLVPKPMVLIPGQQWWLDEFHADLLCTPSGAPD